LGARRWRIGTAVLKLRALRIRNYKAFEDSTFTPHESGLTAVVGVNGSGKTSLWEVLSLLSRLANGWDVAWVRRQFSGRGRSFIGCLPWQQSDREFSLRLTLETDHVAFREVTYEVGWAAHPNTGSPLLSREMLARGETPLLEFDARTGRYSGLLVDDVPFTAEIGYPRLLSVVSRKALAGTKWEPIKTLFDVLASWGVFRFRVLDLGKDLKQLDVTGEPRDRLTVTGDNLHSILFAWKEARAKTAMDDLRVAIHAMLERVGMGDVDWDIRAEIAGSTVFAPIRFVRSSPGRPDATPQVFELAYGPDGFKSVFLLMMALLSPAPLVAIEEPETHLEPRLLDLVADQMRATAEQGTQVIVTTHSPLLCQAMPAESIRVLHEGVFRAVPETVQREGRVMDAWLLDVLHK
jgi:ABC-type transport system involved in cytochrome c biogenesis ATPase subunit